MPYSTLILPPEVKIRGSFDGIVKLAKSIAKEGLHGTLVVIPHDDGFLVKCGIRRYLAISYLLSLEGSVLVNGTKTPASVAFRLISVEVTR